MALIIVPGLATMTNLGIILMDISYAMVIFIGALFVATSMRELIFSMGLGLTIFLLFALRDDQLSINFLNSFLTLIFFLFVFWKLVTFVLKEKEVNLHAIYASVSGYLILGVLAALLYAMIESIIPQSFSVPEDCTFYDFIYFSYITLTSVGYGDIAPILPLAKSVTIIFSIASQFYLTILVAIIIGKYLANESKSV